MLSIPTLDARRRLGGSRQSLGIRVLASVWIIASLIAGASAQGVERGWEKGAGFRRKALDLPTQGATGFTLLSAPELGIAFTNLLSEAKVAQFQNTMNGSGVTAGDYDNDGWCDLFFCNKEGPSALFRNLGNGHFTNVTDAAGVACTQQISSGAIFADLNGDGLLDLVVSSFGGPNAFLVNNGHGGFIDKTREAGLTNFTGSTSIAAADLDGDGDLDLYLCNFGLLSILRDGGQVSTRMVNGKPVVTGRYANKLKIVDGLLTEFGEPDVLFWNDGQGHFTPAKWPETFFDEEGKPIAPPSDFGLAVQIRDINGDGLPDIYVCNDFQTPDRLWINQGKGHFRAVERMALRNMSYASMGTDFADLDRDGHLDFITVEMLSRDHAHHLKQTSPMRPVNRLPGMALDREDMPRNNLFWNRGDGTYAEIAFYAGVAATDWSWTPIFIDVDLDGYEDLLVSNGHMHDVNAYDLIEAARANGGQNPMQGRPNLTHYAKLESPKYAFRNRGDLTFEEVGHNWGFDSTWICHGMCLADIDNDGDLDVILNSVNHPPLIYRNNTVAPRLAIRLQGSGGNGHGVGGKIRVSSPGLPVQTQEILAGGRYLSGDDTLRVFACASSKQPSRVEVTWLSGKQSLIEAATPNSLYEIVEAKAVSPSSSKPLESASTPTPLWKEVATGLDHRHTETPFDDFAGQPLLPRRFSQLGPGISCADFNGDGFDDLIVGSGRSGTISFFTGDGRGGVTPLATQLAPLPDDSAGVLVLPSSSGAVNVLAAVAQWESLDPSRGAALAWEISGAAPSPRPLPALPPLPEGASAGCLAAADYDGDGDLDLFIGGRLVGGRYPEAPASVILKNQEGEWSIDPEASDKVRKVGMVSAAIWSDLDGDGFPELVLACEWGPIRVFQNQRGRLTEKTKELGLDRYTGWWSSIAAGDLDGDGALDLVAGNWGLNGSQQAWAPLPHRLYFGDFADDKSVQMIESIHDAKLQKWVPVLDFAALRTAIPSLRARVPNHDAFAQLSVQEILAGSAESAGVLEANTLGSMVFFNRRSTFEAKLLPREAQWAPVFGISVADVDGDGAEDIFLAQNCFAVRTDETRLDAGRGLLLRGDGTGKMVAVSGAQSGVKVYGEQRGCAVADFNRDGRVDLVLTENGGPTHLFLNQTAKPGIRVELKGPPGNPTGVGAVLRLKMGTKWGSARELHAGSGYWSQDSSIPVLGASSTPTAISVRWPGGAETTTELKPSDVRISIPAPNGR